jgi:hypothetical protein
MAGWGGGSAGPGGEIAVVWRFMGGMHPKGANGVPDRLMPVVVATTIRGLLGAPWY